MDESLRGKAKFSWAALSYPSNTLSQQQQQSSKVNNCCSDCWSHDFSVRNIAYLIRINIGILPLTSSRPEKVAAPTKSAGQVQVKEHDDAA